MKNWLIFQNHQVTYYPETIDDITQDNKIIIHNELFNNALYAAIADNIGIYFDVIDEIPEYEEQTNYICCFYSKNKWHYYDKYDLEITDEIEKIGYVDLVEWRIMEKEGDALKFYDPTIAYFIRKRFKLNINEKYKYNKFEIDLKPYWNGEYNKKIFAKHNILQNIDGEYTFNDIIEYDYVKGLATIENRVENRISKVKFLEISEDDNLNIQTYY